MSITFDVPGDLERQLHADGVDLDREAKEGFLVAQYRRVRISQSRLTAILGLDRFEADELLKRHGIEYGQTLAEYLEEMEHVRGISS